MDQINPTLVVLLSFLLYIYICLFVVHLCIDDFCAYSSLLFSLFFSCCVLFFMVIFSIHVLNSPWKTFEKVYKGIWANNADAISIGYAGTGALKVDFTKTGKRTVKGMINDGVNSCIRYYVNNFTDGTWNCYDNLWFIFLSFFGCC